jgi:hypothetical protein
LPDGIQALDARMLKLIGEEHLGPFASLVTLQSQGSTLSLPYSYSVYIQIILVFVNITIFSYIDDIALNGTLTLHEGFFGKDGPLHSVGLSSLSL